MNLRTDLRWCLRRLPQWAWTTAFALGLFLWGSTASAGLTQSGNVQRTHTHEGHVFWISKADCLSDDDVFTFAFTFTPDVYNYSLQVWASENSNCTLNADRNSSLSKCVMLMDLGTVAKSPVTVQIKSNEIANSLSGVTECIDAGGQTATRKPQISFMLLQNTTQDAVAANVVTYAGSTGTGTGTTVDIGVDLLGPPAPTVLKATAAEAAISVDFTGSSASVTDTQGYYIYCDPPPAEQADTNGGCDCINAGAGTGTGGTSTTTSTTTTTTTTSVTSPPPPNTGGSGAGGDTPQPPPGGAGGTGGMTGGTGGMTGGTGGMTGGTGGMTGGTGGTTTSSTSSGGTAGTAGASGGGAGGGGAGGGDCTSNISADACVSCVLLPDEDPPSDAYLCGRITGTGTTGTAQILTNDRAYAVGVAAYDLLGNVGKLSPIACGTPQAVSDFFETYREAGGKGGGGCAVSPRLRTTSTLAPIFGAIAALTLALRRRKRTATRTSRGAIDRGGDNS